MEFKSQEELDAVIADGRFAVLQAPLWLGVRYTGGQWKGEEGDSVLTVLPWLSGQPASTNEGTPVTVDPNDSWDLLLLVTATQLSRSVNSLPSQ